MMKILSVKGEKPTVDLRNGFYDKNLVCRECEDYFDPLDSYASKFIPSITHYPLLTTSDGLRFREIDAHDAKKLKLFLLSVLWRSHATERSEFNRVALGPYADKLKKLIENNDPDSKNEFPAVLFTFKPHENPELDFSNIAMSPIHRHFNNGRVYELWLFGCLAWIYVGGGNPGKMFENGSVREGQNLYILEKDARDSPYQNTIRDTIRVQDKFNSKRAK